MAAVECLCVFSRELCLTLENDAMSYEGALGAQLKRFRFHMEHLFWHDDTSAQQQQPEEGKKKIIVLFYPAQKAHRPLLLTRMSLDGKEMKKPQQVDSFELKGGRL